MNARLPSTRDFIAGAMFFVLGLGALIEAIRMPLYDEGMRGIVGGPGLTPAMLAVGILLVSLVLMIRNRDAAIRPSRVRPVPGTGRVLAVFILAAAYAAALPYIGYTIATFAALVTFQVAFSHRRGWRYLATVVVISALLAVGLKLLFSKFFFVPLPGELLS